MFLILNNYTKTINNYCVYMHLCFDNIKFRKLLQLLHIKKLFVI